MSRNKFFINMRRHGIITVLHTIAALVLFSCDNYFMQAFLPEPLSGTALVHGENRIGQTLILDTSGISGGSGIFAYQWLADGAAIAGETGISYTIRGIDAGKIISCMISRGASPDRVITPGRKVPYTIVIETIGNASGESVTISPDTGDAEVELILHYTVVESISFDYLAFSGISIGIEMVSAAGTGTRPYTVNAADATDGIITITATFTHQFYTVSFNANGATSGTIPSEQTTLRNEFILLPASGNLAKTGFAFGSWNTQADGNGDNYIPGHLYQVTGSQTLYARWVAEQNHVFPFVPPENNTPVVSGITISQTGDDNYPVTGTMTVNNTESYTLIEWFYGSVPLGEGPSLELDARNILYNLEGTHTITVVAWQDGVPYSLRITFLVVR